MPYDFWNHKIHPITGHKSPINKNPETKKQYKEKEDFIRPIKKQTEKIESQKSRMIRTRIMIIEENGKENLFESALAASAFLGVSNDTISRIINKKRKNNTQYQIFKL